MLRTFSLGTRLALITIAGTLTTVASVLLIAYSALVEDFESILTHQQRYETQRIARTVDEKLNLRVDLLSEFAKNLSDGWSLRDRTEMEQLLARQQMLQQLFPDGLVVFDENATALLETLHVPGRIGTNYADREHFQRLMRTRQPVISRPMIGRAHRRSPGHVLRAHRIRRRRSAGYRLGRSEAGRRQPAAARRIARHAEGWRALPRRRLQ